MSELLATFLAGIALFFYGVNGIKRSLQGLTSRRLRRQLARWSDSSLYAGFWGFSFGAITQSATAVAFILTGLVEAGVVTLANALPIVSWANLGTVVLVFIASFNLRVLYLYLLGLAGIGLAFEVGGARWRPVIATLFSIGLLFYGLSLMKTAFGPLSAFDWFHDLTTFIQGSNFGVLIAGAMLRILTQSSSSIAVIAVALSQGGLLNLNQSVMMIYGTGMGVGLSIVFLSANLRGVPRRLVIYQAAINTFSATFLALLFYVEISFDVPLLLAAIERVTDNQGLRLAFAYLALQSNSVAVSLIIAKPAARWLEHFFPATDEQDLARLQYISDQALGDPESALQLVEKEQSRLLKRMPAMLASIRQDEASSSSNAAPSILYAATQNISKELETFLSELANQETDHETSERLLVTERRQAILDGLNESVHRYTKTFKDLITHAQSPDTFLESLTEGLNTLLLSAIDTCESEGEWDIQLLHDMTSDRSALMERSRNALAAKGKPLSQQQKSQVTYLTTLFERIVWQLRQFSQIQKNARAL